MAVRKASYKAGDEVESRCTKCKLILAHTIVAMVGDSIARVKCNTCGGEHVYRPPPTASEATAKRRRAERKASALDRAGAISTASEYDELMRGRDSARAPVYAPTMSLNRNDLVSHPKFGVGLVTEIKEGKKAHVAFPDGGKILVFGR